VGEAAGSDGATDARAGWACRDGFGLLGWCSPFIGVGRAPGRLTPALLALTPLKMGRLDERLRREIKGGEMKARR
jgi:hypothetical protein